MKDVSKVAYKNSSCFSLEIEKGMSPYNSLNEKSLQKPVNNVQSNLQATYINFTTNIHDIRFMCSFLLNHLQAFQRQTITNLIRDLSRQAISFEVTDQIRDKLHQSKLKSISFPCTTAEKAPKKRENSTEWWGPWDFQLLVRFHRQGSNLIDYCSARNQTNKHQLSWKKGKQ